jgi:hypothetical protein
VGFFRTFRARLFVVMVLVATIPTALLGSYSYLRVSEYLEKSALSEARDRLAAANEFDGFVGFARADVLCLSRRPALQALLDAHPRWTAHRGTA